MSLNIYYFLAVLCLALSACFGYLGSNYESRRSGDDQLDKLSTRFDELGAKISKLQSGSKNEDVGDISKEYSAIARDYMTVLPQKAQQLRVDAEQARLSQIQKSREIQKVADFVSNTLAGLVAGFRKEGTTIDFEGMAFPSNIFSQEHYRLKLLKDRTNYWSIHLVDREIGKIGMMFVRVIINGNKQEYLTNDSIVYRWIGEDRYVFSLNDRISVEAKANLMEGLDTNVHPLSQSESDLKRFLVNLVKYELART